MKKFNSILLAVILVLLSACGGSGGGNSGSTSGELQVGGDVGDPSEGDGDSEGDSSEGNGSGNTVTGGYRFVSSYRSTADNYRIDILHPETNQLTVVGNPSFASYGFPINISKDQSIDATTAGIMLNDHNLYFLDPIQGTASIIDRLSVTGDYCKGRSFLNNPGEIAIVIALEFAGEDGACGSRGDNESVAANISLDSVSVVSIDQDFMATAVELLDSQNNRVGYLGLSNRKIVAWNNSFDEVASIADSPNGEIITLSAPGSAGHVFFSDGSNVYWGLPSQIMSVNNRTPIASSSLYHVQAGDDVYFFSDESTIMRGNLLDGSLSEFMTVDYYLSITEQVSLTSTSLVFIGYEQITLDKQLIAIDLLSKSVTVVKAINDRFGFEYVAGFDAIFINDDDNSAFIASSDGIITNSYDNAYWRFYKESGDIYPEVLRPMLVSAESSNGKELENVTLTTYNLNNGLASKSVGYLEGIFTVTELGTLFDDEILLTISPKDKPGDLYQLNTSAEFSLIQITNTDSLSEMPSLRI